MTEWRQFMQSGFFFRFENNQIQQGALLVCCDDESVGWAMCTPSSASKYAERADLWQVPPMEYLCDLQQIPAFMTGNDNYSWALGVIAE